MATPRATSRLVHAQSDSSSDSETEIGTYGSTGSTRRPTTPSHQHRQRLARNPNLKPQAGGHESTHPGRSPFSQGHLDELGKDGEITAFMSHIFDVSGSMDDSRPDKMSPSWMWVRLRYYVPIFRWLPLYSFANFRSDLIAGVTVAFLLIPGAISYAAGMLRVPPVYGLYTGVWPLLVYTVFGTSKQLSCGPDAIVSILSGSIIHEYLSSPSVAPPGYTSPPEPHLFENPSTDPHPALDPQLATRLETIATLTLLVGLFTFFLGFFRLGFLDSILSKPMIRGFVLALATLIMIEQAPGMLGIDKAALEPEPINNEPYEPTPFQKLSALLSHLGLAHTPTFTVSVVTVTVLLIARKIKHSIKRLQLLPEVLIIMIAATYLSWQQGWSEAGIPVLGPAKGGLVAPTFPNLRPGAVRGLTTPAILVSIIGFVEAITASKHLAAHHNEPLRPNRELVALGMNNIVGSALGTFPSFGSLPRSMVNDRAGARTQMAGLVTAVVVLLTCFFAMPLLTPLPQCVLSSVIFVVASDLLEVDELAFLVRVRGWSDLGMAAGTFLATTLVGVESGTIISIAASLLLVVRETAGVSIEVMGRVKVPHVGRDGGAGAGDGGRVRYKYKYVGLSEDAKAARRRPTWDEEGHLPGDSVDSAASWSWLWGSKTAGAKEGDRAGAGTGSAARHGHHHGNASGPAESQSAPTLGLSSSRPETSTPPSPTVMLGGGLFPVLKIPGILLLRISEPLFFGNVGHLREQVRRAEMYGELGAHPGEDPPSAQEAGGGNALFGVVLEVSGVTGVDPSALSTLIEMVSSFSDRTVSVCFVKLPASCTGGFERAGLWDAVESGGGGFFQKIGDAVEWLEEAERGKKSRSVLIESFGYAGAGVDVNGVGTGPASGAGVGGGAAVSDRADDPDTSVAWARDRTKGMWRKLRGRRASIVAKPMSPVDGGAGAGVGVGLDGAGAASRPELMRYASDNGSGPAFYKPMASDSGDSSGDGRSAASTPLLSPQGSSQMLSFPNPFTVLTPQTSPKRAALRGAEYHNVVTAEQGELEGEDEESSGDELDSGTLKTLQRGISGEDGATRARRVSGGKALDSSRGI
ncbi:hypothetical protein M427DRAFT_27490 [Gonapodya prolifera JEL478]|uniref:STAS domain-containing protein n=1 Tax=Gonapodya prolifera (strain JEL478) TaxID=1344416 RepID=A0A139AYZ9_GONPJ|nr:hypothetical protein M427DRAFT_27490 [Gonapodya prolifera JEL478]|eukprot:KXS21961.1 hypothetical protein M427DRAFT_27490 [Gonapodya prolifera JEL478]